MRGLVGGERPRRALVGWSCVGCLLGACAPSTGASDLDRLSRPTSSRPTLEDKIPELKRSRAGARERLGDPRCLAVLRDFRSVSHRGLDEELRATGRTAQEQMDALAFRSGLGRYECSRGALAFTRIGSSVVSICLRPFTLLPRADQEAILIHELLHSLGLGENPPESVAITTQVQKRCGP
jgi:hypothetical protein